MTKVTRTRRASPSLVLGGIIIGVMVLVAIVAVFWTPYNPLALDTSREFLRPSLSHPFGTDEYGRDILSRVMAGTTIALESSVGALLIALVGGVPLGLVAATSRGVLSEVVMRFIDLIYAFPALLAAITLVTAFGASTLIATVAIGVASIPVFARVVRGAALGVLASEYVLAARAYGRSWGAILRRHVLPNIMPVIIVQSSLLLSLTVLAVSALSYLGLGTPPPAATWGGMLNSAQSYLSSDPQMMIWPGLAIAVTVFGFNALGDGLRELLDPRLRRRS